MKLDREMITACIDANGNPCLVSQMMSVTQKEIDEGETYTIAERKLLDNGYEMPMVHFMPEETPDYLNMIRHKIPMV